MKCWLWLRICMATILKSVAKWLKIYHKTFALWQSLSTTYRLNVLVAHWLITTQVRSLLRQRFIELFKKFLTQIHPNSSNNSKLYLERRYWDWDHFWKWFLATTWGCGCTPNWFWEWAKCCRDTSSSECDYGSCIPWCREVREFLGVSQQRLQHKLSLKQNHGVTRWAMVTSRALTGRKCSRQTELITLLAWVL